MTRKVWMMGVAIVALPGGAWAETQPLGELETGPPITVTATRIPTPVGNVPATVTVIDDREIADELATDARDLVRFEPGVSVPRSPARFSAALGATGRGGNSGFNIRGIGGNRVLIQVDGIRVPDGFAFGAQLAGRGDYVDLGLIRSVEILRGPASALYGSDGLAGAVSFQTSDPADLLEGRGHSMRATGTYDSASDEFSETAIAAAGGGAWSGLVAYTRRDGHQLDNQGVVGGTGAARTEPNPQDTHADSVLGKIVLAPNDSNRFRLTAEYGDTATDTEVLSTRSATTLDLYGRDSTERSRVSLDWRYSGGGAIDFAQVALYWQDGRNRQFTFEDRNPAADRSRLNTFDNRVIGATAEARSTFATGVLHHTISFGGDSSLTRQEGLRDGTVPPAGESFPARAFPVTDYTRAGLFVGDEIAVGSVTLYPALRFDHYSLDPKDDPLLPGFAGADQSGSRLTPRIGAVARLGAGFSLYGNYASGFRAPAPSDVNQFFQNILVHYTSIPNPNLRPETSTTWEGGLRYQGPIASASLTGFTGRYHDFISQQQIGGSFTVADPGIFQVINLSGVRIKGVEGRLGLHLPRGFTADLAFAWADGDVVHPGGARSPLSSIDPFKIVVGAGWRDPRGRFGGQVYLTHAARKPLDETTGVCSAACYRPDSSTVLDATAFWRINANFTLRAGLFNITDARYANWSDVVGLAATSNVTDAYTQPGRNTRVSLSVRF